MLFKSESSPSETLLSFLLIQETSLGGRHPEREDSALPAGMTATLKTHADIHTEDLPVVMRHTRSLAALFV